jgi:hypothetical protein
MIENRHTLPAFYVRAIVRSIPLKVAPPTSDLLVSPSYQRSLGIRRSSFIGFHKLREAEMRVNTCISAVQNLRPLRGGAQAHLLRASDGAWCATKFQNNPQHIRVLANEMFTPNLVGAGAADATGKGDRGFRFN